MPAILTIDCPLVRAMRHLRSIGKLEWKMNDIGEPSVKRRRRHSYLYIGRPRQLSDVKIVAILWNALSRRLTTDRSAKAKDFGKAVC
jgi:hypothetical protein